MCFVHDGSEDAIRVGQEHRPQQFTVSSTNCSGEILGGRQYPARSEFRGKECSVRIRCPACPLSGRTVSSPCCGMVFADEGAVASGDNDPWHCTPTSNAWRISFTTRRQGAYARGECHS